MRRICEELEKIGKTSGHDYKVLRWDALKFPLEYYPKYVLILYLDIMRHRDDLIYGLCVMEEFTRADVKLIPRLQGFYNSDKFANYLLWHRFLKPSIEMPDTLCCINLEMGIKFLNKYHKVIFKPISGSQGIGIEILETKHRLEELMAQYHALFLQEIIPDRGYDIRTLVIGDHFTAQYARYNPQQILKNIHLGASPKSISDMAEIDPQVTEFAEQSRRIATKIRDLVGLDLVGVDTLPSKDGILYLIEWNSVPGFRGAEEATKFNIGKVIVDLLFAD
ncbi:MAG: ATP-grasp domain-containing protein [Promethearchaeota archaeon]|nr:MAG: ATP-grasp domain-containing protein [Candidatus Lokiarchaeota archaeon]